MTPDNQREALAALAEVWSLSPDVRLGQLMAHLGFLGEVYLDRGLSYIDDDELVSVIYRHREQLIARTHSEPHSSPPTLDLMSAPPAHSTSPAAG